MVDVTLLELNVDGVQLSTGGSDGVSTDDGESADAGGGDRPWLAGLVGLLFLALLAVLAKRRLGGDEEPA